MMEGTTLFPAEVATCDDCPICSGIDVRRPFCGPQTIRLGSGKVTRVCYGHAQTLHKLLTSALETNCHLCYLILNSIRKHYVLIANKKNVLDDWDLVDEIDDLDGSGDDDSDEDENEDEDRDSGGSPQVQSKYRRFFYGPEAIFDDVGDIKSPIVLEFNFRAPKRDELKSRCIDIVVHWTQTGGRARLSSSALTLVAHIPDQLARLCEARDIQNDIGTDSTYSFELARLWLKSCDTEHELCRARKEQRELLLPTRVIDVADVHSRPRLIELLREECADYVCLSHCWGRSQPFKTEQNSLAERKVGMDVDNMPKTFRDAIMITRNLGIQYLWIDSLCIIQDSAEDWARESAQMGKIYRDAAVTIFAKHADSDDGGCFSSRSARASLLCRTPIFDELVSVLEGRDCDTLPTFIQAKLHHAGSHSLPEHHSIFETIKALDPRQFPLDLRAWVLQESILSHRALLYDEDELRWTCPTVKACECLPEGHIRQSWSRFDKGDAETVSTRELSNAWALIVHEFSTRRLTYNKDKLPALAGIASEMQRYKHSTYLAGLWQDDLRINLSWFVFPRSANAPYRETKRIQESTIPSWSWAKIEGEVRMRVHYDDLNNEPKLDDDNFNRAQSLLCELIDCKTTPSNPLNPFGDVRTGFLGLRGRLGQAVCCAPVTDTFYIDRIPIKDTWSNLQTGWFDPDVSPIPSNNPVNKIWCMPLYNNHGNLICLALIPASADRVSRSRAEYPSSICGRIFERVGIVSPKLVRFNEEIPPGHFSTAPEQNSALQSWFETCEVESIVVV